MAPRLVLTPSQYVFRRGVVEGIFGRSRLWKVVGYSIVVRRILRRVMGAEPRTVAVEKIKPGETLILRGVTTRGRG